MRNGQGLMASWKKQVSPWVRTGLRAAAGVAILAGLALPALALPAMARAADGPVPLHVAVEKGLVDVEVVGRGSSTGDSVQVRVKRKGGANVSVSVDPGTVIQPKGTAVQTMALAGVKYKQVQGGWQQADTIELKDDSQQTYILEGYCRDIEKPTPKTQDSFAVNGPDAENAKVLVQAKRLGATVKVTQSAIWIQRSKMSDDQLKKFFQVSTEELNAARQLLVSVEKPEEKSDVDVKVLLDKVRQFAARPSDGAVKRGDTVEITVDEAELKTRFGGKPVGSLKKGVQLEVAGIAADAVIVIADVDGKKQRGTLKMADVKVVKSAAAPAANRPFARAVRQVLDDVHLEVFDKVDVTVGDQE